MAQEKAIAHRLVMSREHSDRVVKTMRSASPMSAETLCRPAADQVSGSVAGGKAAEGRTQNTPGFRSNGRGGEPVRHDLRSPRSNHELSTSAPTPSIL